MKCIKNDERVVVPVLKNIPNYENEEAAIAGGLVPGSAYKNEKEGCIHVYIVR